MNKHDIIRIAENFIEQLADNHISQETAITKNIAGLTLFEPPIFGFGAADDENFLRLMLPEAVGKHFILPTEWLPSAKSVISFFLPFTEEVRASNARDMKWPSEEWLHARIEGQAVVSKLCQHLESELNRAGFPSLVPSLDERFWSNSGTSEQPGVYTSNWSERHVAFVCGLGTFGLSRGLITRKGIAGRFGSIVTELSLEPDDREYTDLYEYCTMCGLCANNCPVEAISIGIGKNHRICSDFLDETKVRHITRYACGKCQVAVPCEARIPNKV
jgi:epoxyqueuosine reductase QueG